MKLGYFVLSLFLASSLAFACSSSDAPNTDSKSDGRDAAVEPDDDDDGGADPPKAATKANVQAIVDRECVTCHDGNNDDTTLVLKDIGACVGKASEVTKGTLIVAGKPDESVLIKAVEGARQGALDPMPYGTEGLEKKDSEILRAWVAAGAP